MPMFEETRHRRHRQRPLFLITRVRSTSCPVPARPRLKLSSMLRLLWKPHQAEEWYNRPVDKISFKSFHIVRCIMRQPIANYD